MRQGRLAGYARSPLAALALAVSATMLPAAAEAVPTPTPHVPELVASGAAQPVSALAADRRLDLAISLPLRHEAQLDALLKSLYDPSSLLFRRYLGVREFTERFGPSQADYDAVLQFAAASGLSVTRTSANRRLVEVSGRVADIEKAFGIHLNVYRSPSQSRVFYAPDREPAPALHTAILHVSGLDDFSPPVSHFSIDPAAARAESWPDSWTEGTGSGPLGSFLGSDARAAYYGDTALTGAGQSLALLEFGSYNISDVQKYFSVLGQPLKVPVVGVSVDGVSVACTGFCFDAEPVLDIVQAISMAPGLSQVVAYVGKNPVSILNQMASDNTSRQISSSWGWDLASTSIDDPIFKEFAAQGQSFLDASSDFGYQLTKGRVWPADDQYVTAVGGTDLVTQGPGGAWQSETGWAHSGGGPSPDEIPIPDYQVPFINAANQGAPTLRNIPDIAGIASDFYLCFDGICSVGGAGTSFATPLWAGFVALANEQAAQQGRPPLGFLNPTLYAIGGSSHYHDNFHDEVSGYNGMFTAVSGFDLVTGFGSPNGQALIDALIAGG